MPKKTKLRKGFTLIEIIISISIIAILSAVIFMSIVNFRNRQIIKNTAIEVTQAIEEAKIKTMTGFNDEVHGVHFEESSVSLFEGTSYDAEDAGTVVLFSDEDILFTPTLVGGDDIVFERLTGETDNTGTILIELVSDSEYNTTVEVSGTGIISF